MTKTAKYPCHHDNLTALKRIEGQVRGIQKMIAENRYCIDILIQLNSIVGAVERVENSILETHLEHCFTEAVTGKSAKDKQKKIDEVISLLKKFRKN